MPLPGDVGSPGPARAANPAPLPGSAAPAGQLPSDRSLVEGMARGESAALAQLFDRHGKTLFAVALRVLSDRHEAEEALLEGFAQAWHDARRFDATRGSVGAWLTMIVRSRALDRLRTRLRRERATARAAELTTMPAMGAGSLQPDDSVLTEELRRHVVSALDSLPPEQRQPIELAFYEGLSHSEIAARLDLPLGTVKTRIRGGMQALREALRPLLAQEDP